MAPERRYKGFTLIELLVVVGIIAMLAGIILPAVTGALRRADISRAEHEMSQIRNGIKAYYGEYGRFPVPEAQGTADLTYAGKSEARHQAAVMNILRAKDSTNNPKGFVFVEIPEDSREGTDHNGNTYTASDGYFLDPWGNPYIIAMDCNYDGRLQVSGAGNPADAIVKGLSVAGDGIFDGLTVGVMSYGANPGRTNSFMTTW